MNRGEVPEPPVHSITGAVSPHSDDLDARIRRYLISMSLRVVCVLLAIALYDNWTWWIFAVGAVILPYIAVVMANAVDRRRIGSGPPPVTPQARYSLPPAAPDDIPFVIHPPNRESDDTDHSQGSARPFAAGDGNSPPVFLVESPSSSEQSK